MSPELEAGTDKRRRLERWHGILSEAAKEVFLIMWQTSFLFPNAIHP